MHNEKPHLEMAERSQELTSFGGTPAIEPEQIQYWLNWYSMINQAFHDKRKKCPSK